MQIVSKENRLWNFMQIVSLGDNLHEMSKPVFWEKMKNVSKHHLLKVLQFTLHYTVYKDSLSSP